jgi:hypothetical protein
MTQPRRGKRVNVSRRSRHGASASLLDLTNVKPLASSMSRKYTVERKDEKEEGGKTNANPRAREDARARAADPFPSATLAKFREDPASQDRVAIMHTALDAVITELQSRCRVRAETPLSPRDLPRAMRRLAHGNGLCFDDCGARLQQDAVLLGACVNSILATNRYFEQLKRHARQHPTALCVVFADDELMQQVVSANANMLLQVAETQTFDENRVLFAWVSLGEQTCGIYNDTLCATGACDRTGSSALTEAELERLRAAVHALMIAHDRRQADELPPLPRWLETLRAQDVEGVEGVEDADNIPETKDAPPPLPSLAQLQKTTRDIEHCVSVRESEQAVRAARDARHSSDTLMHEVRRLRLKLKQAQIAAARSPNSAHAAQQIEWLQASMTEKKDELRQAAQKSIAAEKAIDDKVAALHVKKAELEERIAAAEPGIAQAERNAIDAEERFKLQSLQHRRRVAVAAPSA